MKKKIKIICGLLISIVFFIIAFRKVNLIIMFEAIREAKGGYLIIAILFVLISAWLRALRWKYLLYPIKRIELTSLFSALLIGYATNFVVPAHLGEVVRAYIVGKKRQFPASSALATIVTERVIDMITFLILIIFTLFLYPFPDWVKQSSKILSVATVFLILLLIAMKLKSNEMKKIISFLTKPLPESARIKIDHLFDSFLKGLVAPKIWWHYIYILFLSIIIWLGYIFVFAFGFKSFGFQLPWIAPLVLMVITTISIVVPSSPGYIGTYHFLCQIGLAFFCISKSAALGFAFVIHGINTIPFLILGFFLGWREGINLFQISQDRTLQMKQVSES